MGLKNVLLVVVATSLVLLVPLVAMQFTDEVQWDGPDFIVAGTLLMLAGLTYEYIVNTVTQPLRRTVYVLMLVFAVFLIWAELSVGIFD